jgi:GNAT superfamily N-acetyltransferase
MDAAVRVSDVSDASQIASVLCRSIEQLCHLDHGGDEQIVNTWLSNKTEESVARWIMSPRALTLVAEGADQVMGVGMIDHRGEILLLYVAPEAVRQGFGSRLLRCLVDAASDWGLGKVTAGSTVTASGFYHSHGFAFAGDPRQKAGLWEYPMEYSLASEN